MQQRRIRRSLHALTAAGIATASVAACSTSHHHRRLGAAEPAVAPAATRTPAGTVITLGNSPEGIVFDPKTNLVAVTVRMPSRMLLLDGKSLALRSSVVLPGTVRHLQLAGPGGPVLTPIESIGSLDEVSLPTGTQRLTRVGKQPHDATAAGGGLIVVGNEFSMSIAILRAGTVLTTLTGVRQPGGVSGDGATVAVVDVGAFTVSTFDLNTRKRTAVLAAGQGPTHGMLASRHRLVVTDTRGNALLVFGLRPLAATGHVALAGAPYGMALDASTDTVWVTLTARNEVVGFDVSTDTPREIARYPTVRQPNTVAVAPGSHSIWVTGTAAGQLQLIKR